MEFQHFSTVTLDNYNAVITKIILLLNSKPAQKLFESSSMLLPDMKLYTIKWNLEPKQYLKEVVKVLEILKWEMTKISINLITYQVECTD